ncbi:hypothetical protein ES703_106546 [subsurface metagenome]
MSKQSQTPKWATPERQAILVDLWAMYGNKCLQGHTACMNPEHYTYIVPVAEIVGKPVKYPCHDGQGNLKKDSEGKTIYLTLYKPQAITINQPITSRLYDYITELVIDGWKADDREARGLEYRLESRILHHLAEPTYPLRGAFSAISKDIWASNQPLFYLQNLGMSGVTFKPFAKVRLSSSYLRLYVDLGNLLRGVSKSKRRKAIRYGKPLPLSIQERISAKIREAVNHYLDH